MENKFLKIITSIIVMLTMTMTNFIFVGSSLISYAIDNISTNNNNVEFGVYFKDSNGKEVSNLESGLSSINTNLYLKLKVKQEGYFNGKIELVESNFTLKATQSEYINKIEGNTVTLNQINAGTEVVLDIPVEFKKDEAFNLGLLDMESKINLRGVYRDRAEKDKQIKADKTVKLKLIPQNITSENIENNLEIITNKTLKVSGQDKRVIQILFNIGLKDNSYPVKEINVNTNIPDMNGNQPQVSQVINTNTMTYYEYNNENKEMNIQLKNDVSTENNVVWKNEGKENIVLTYIYDINDIEDITLNEKVSVILQDNTKIETEIKDIKILQNEEKEEVVKGNIINTESSINKGKLYQSIDRTFTTVSTINVNAANILNYLNIKEEDVFITSEEQELASNIVYQNTTVNKEQLFKVLGENGIAKIINELGETITTISSTTQADELGNIVVDYGEGQRGIRIETSAPITAGKFNIINQKIIKQNNINTVKNIVALKSKVLVGTNLNEGKETPILSEVKVTLLETATDAKIEINKNELSTVIENDVEIKATLKTNNDINDLYKNPILRIEFPEDVEVVNINKLALLYDSELQGETSLLDGRVLTIKLQGEQTRYSESAIEGPTIIINATLKLNRRSATKDAQIAMKYENEKANSYVNNGVTSVPIKIVAPTDVTTITTVPQLGIEEIGQDKSAEVMLKRGQEEKEITPQIEIINNKENTISDVKILGTFPTKEKQDAVNMSLTSGIKVQNAKVYYTENKNATADLENLENGWSEEIKSAKATEKYLIAVEQLESQESISASYGARIASNLEYNENAEQSYEVTYKDAKTNIQDTVKGTQIKLTTGVGPVVDTKVTAKVGRDTIKNGDTVVAGEVIRYTVEVENTGSEDAGNVNITALVPEGTTYVEPKEEFGIAGASYYKEIIDKKNYENKIDNLKVGEKQTFEYDVRVNSDIKDGNITNKSTIKYRDVIKDSEELKASSKSGDLRVSVKRLSTDDGFETNGTIKYYVLVENISDTEQKNVKLNSHLSSGVKVINNTVDLLYEGIDEELTNQNEDEVIKSKEIEYKDEIDLETFEPRQMKLLYFTLTPEKNGKIDISFDVKQKDNKYRSNLWEDEIKSREANISISSNQEKYVKSGDLLSYTLNVKNLGNADTYGLFIVDQINPLLKIERIIVNGQEDELPENNEVVVELNMKGQEESVVEIQTTVKDIEDTSEATTISNKAIVEYKGEQVAKTEELTHIIEAKTQQNGGNGEEDENGNGNSNGGTANKDNNIASGSRIISGIAWFDENKNGKKDDNEGTLSGIKANLLNVETNKLVKDTSGKVLEATTSDNGTYILNNIENGKYIVVFNYNKSEYGLTKYKVDGVEESKNSNATMNDLQIEENSSKVASTDIIQIDNNNIADINIGLIKLENFDLKLDKFVSKVVVQNASGTSSTEYTDSTMAKAEIHSKHINGSTVLIEYKIRVTNVGEVDGYVKSIVDYMPSDLKFSSELNKDWYQSGANLYNESLANDKIIAGEAREIKLTLTKTMTEDNTGLVNNTAEIAEAYNELGLQDSNSTPGNKTQGENDMGSADVIISIKTGEIIFYTTLITVIIITLLSVITIPIIKKSRKNKTRHKFDKI